MTEAEPSRAETAFLLGYALATGRVSAAPDDQYESARGALQHAISLGDPEWSPRAAYVLGELSVVRGRLDVADHNTRLAIDSGHPDWAPAAYVVLGLLEVARGNKGAAMSAYDTAIASGHPEHAPHAWFNMGTLIQSRGEAGAALYAFQQAVISEHPMYAAKAAVNLGFVAFNDLGDVAMARAAFHTALSYGDPQQSALAAQNLAAMDHLTAEGDAGRPQQVTDDGVNVSQARPQDPIKRRWFSSRPQR